MTTARNLFIIMPSLNHGGAERFTLNLMNLLRNDLTIEALFIKEAGAFRSQIPKEIGVKELSLKRGRDSVLAISKYLFQLPSGLIFSSGYMNGMIAFVCTLLKRNKDLIVRETSIVNDRKNFFSTALKKILYPNCRAVIFQSSYALREFERNAGLNLSNAVILENPFLARSMKKKSRKEVLFIGRMEEIKGIDRLMRIIDSMLDSGAVFHIIGDGPLSSQMERFCHVRKILYEKFNNNIPAVLENASLILNTSYYENFSNVLIEAMASEVPALVTDAPGMNAELVGRWNTGWVAADEDEFIGLLKSFCRHEIAIPNPEDFDKFRNYFSSELPQLIRKEFLKFYE